MAAVTSGVIETNHFSYNGSGDTYLWLSWEQVSQSASGTKISWELWGYDDRYVQWEVGPVYAYINGTCVHDFSVNGDGTYGDHSEGRYQFGGWEELASGEMTIPHNSDGTKSFTMSVTGVVRSHGETPNITASDTFELTPIVVSHTVYFDERGGTAVSNKTVTNGAAYGTLPTTTKTGYTFAGWYTAASGGTRVYASTASKSADETLYAHWTANKYKLIYNANGGRLVDDPSITSVTIEDIVYDSTSVHIESPSELFLKNGATCTGWNTKADGSGTSWNNKIGTDYLWKTASNVTLYAQWSVSSKCKVTFDLKGGTSDEGNGPIVRTVNKGASATPPAGVSKTGKVFMGWSGNYTNVTQDCTVYAVWGTVPVWILVEESGKKVWKSYLDI